MPSLIGNKPNQVPSNGDLGTMAFQDANAVNITGGTATVNSLSNTGVTTVQAGTVSLPAITTTGDTNTGIYFPAADTIAFTEGGVESMRITSAGNVGIGTTSPSYQVEVSNSQNTTTTIAVTNVNTGTATQSSIRLNNSTVGVTSLGYTGSSFTTSGVFRQDGGYVYSSGAGGLSLITASTNPLYFATNNTERMRIDGSGNVGIGTTSPGSRLDVSGLARATGFGMNATGGAPATGIAAPASDTLGFYTNTIERMRIDASGNVLIGKTSATANGGDLQVSSGITFPATQVAKSDANTLDDYEEGTWTPVITSEGGSISAYTSEGTYTKIGNTVRVTGYTVLTTVGTASGRAFIAGFPFAGTSSTDFIQPGSISREAQATGYIYFAYLNGANTNGVIQNETAGAIAWSNGYKYSWTITYKC
jgi:hypothetical protein